MSREFVSHEAVRAAIFETHSEGDWEVLPADEPTAGRNGYAVFRAGPGATEEGAYYCWPVTGTFLEPRVSVVEDAEDMASFLEEHPEAVKANNAGRRLLGFAHYDVEACVSLVCQIRTDVLKASEDRFKGPILTALEEAVDVSSDRMKEAAALAGALRNRKG